MTTQAATLSAPAFSRLFIDHDDKGLACPTVPALRKECDIKARNCAFESEDILAECMIATRQTDTPSYIVRSAVSRMVDRDRGTSIRTLTFADVDTCEEALKRSTDISELWLVAVEETLPKRQRAGLIAFYHESEIEATRPNCSFAERLAKAYGCSESYALALHAKAEKQIAG